MVNEHLGIIMERWQSWSIASDLKSDESHGSEGSNPSLSLQKREQIPSIFFLRLVKLC
jgi:hypothetical protein